MGKKLAQGGFGTVYRGDMVDDDTDEVTEVIIKKVN